jgi:hypothetical protein
VTIAGTRPWIDGAIDVTNNIRHVRKFSFSANKNGTDQTALSDNTYTKVTFGTEAWDHGAQFDTSTSRWTPAVSGVVRLTAVIFLSGCAVSNQCLIAIYKNGSELRIGPSTIADGSGVCGLFVSVLDVADGDDYYEVFVNGQEASGGSLTVNGAAALSYFQGEVM